MMKEKKNGFRVHLRCLEMNNFIIPSLYFSNNNTDWKQQRLGDLVSIYSGWTPSEFKIADEHFGYMFIKVDDLNRTTREQTTSKMHVEEHKRLKKIKKGSIIFPKRGAAIMTNKIRILKKESYMDTNMMSLEAKNIDINFLYSLLQKEKLYKIADTSTLPQINNKHIEPYLIYLPSMDEQKTIGLFFKNLDELISLHQQELDAFKRTKQGFLQKMFPKGENIIPELRFSEFNDPWFISELSDIVSEISTGKSKYVKGNSTGNYHILGSTGVIGYEDSYEYEGDFLLTARVGANAGQLYKYSGKVKITDNTVFIKGDNLTFIQPLLELFDLKKLSFGSGQPLIKTSQLKKLKLRVPLPSEQVKIGEFFRQLDEVIELKEQEIEALKQTKQGFLQKMFI